MPTGGNSGSMSRRRSNSSITAPSNTTWRRQRLLQIGQPSTAINPAAAIANEEVQILGPELSQQTSYGTIPDTPRTSKNKLNFRRGLRALPGLNTAFTGPTSRPTSPGHSPSLSFRDANFFRVERPISAYDHPIATPSGKHDPIHEDFDVKTNGIRVWYSSFTSIDWLHDAIKDSARHGRLMRRKSRRGRLIRILDRSLGWIVVTIVGFLTAVIAFMIVRSEQWFFDIKEGYCSAGWLKAKRFCCPRYDETTTLLLSPFSTVTQGPSCGEWRTWADVFVPVAEANDWIRAELFEYLIYAVLALSMAVVSSLLTIHLTASSSFSTRKNSGVLSDAFAENAEGQKVAKAPTTADPKRKVLYYAAGSGIPEIKTILSGFVIHGYLGGRTLFTKATGLVLSVAAGLSLGKEGPFVHIASCVGNIVSRFFPKYELNEGKRREILSAASAAGVAVAFGAPIGGVLFSLEEVSYFFPAKVMWRSLFCAMVAAITLKSLDPFGSGKLVLFQVTYDKDWHAYELVFFVFLGVFGGVWGAYFSKLNHRWSRDIRNKTWLKNHPVVEVFLITLITTVFCFLNPYTRMGGTELVYNLFAECRTPDLSHSGLCVIDPPSQAPNVIMAIFVAMIVKGALTVVTFGIKLPAGIFIPTLGVGACAGRILGILVQWMQFSYPESPVFRGCGGDLNCVIPGLYAMVGAAATLSGVTRTTVSLAVIMFELTDTLTYAVPVMLAVLVAKTVADALEPKGIYDLVIELSQLPYLDAKHTYVWGPLQMNDVTDKDVAVIRLDEEHTVKALRDKLQILVSSGNDDSGFPILRPDGDATEGSRLVGFIGASELEHALTIVADDGDMPVSFHPTTPNGHRATDYSMTSSVSSLIEDGGGLDPFDFSVYMDQAPLTVQSNSPLELVQQFFTKLGTRYVVVMDTDGYYEGVIDKKTWLAFLGELEAKSHH